MASTYRIIQVGSYGPAHPMHNPQVRVYVDGAQVCRMNNAREAHMWCIRQGYTPEDEALLRNEKYQAMMAQVRYEASGL